MSGCLAARVQGGAVVLSPEAVLHVASLLGEVQREAGRNGRVFPAALVAVLGELRCAAGEVMASRTSVPAPGRKPPETPAPSVVTASEAADWLRARGVRMSERRVRQLAASAGVGALRRGRVVVPGAWLSVLVAERAA